MRKEGDVRAKKSLGQHFLNDEQLAASIVEALVLPESCTDVLEIGPGMGVLTKYLLNRDDIRLRVIEIDRESVSYLLQHYPQLNGKIIEGDFLQLNLPELFTSTFAIIGNFPYNISTQILFRILELKDKIPVMVGMFQSEVAERIASGPGNRDYGILSVLLQPWYEMEILYDVPDSSFTPPPRVQSAVLRMIRNDRTSLRVDEVWFKKVIKQAFSMRRKTLRNALKPFLQDTKGPVPYLDLRAEALSWQQFEELALALRN
jgi:16S rRNA (adenine1518-N6/adenine1519-N6)-dimethyltransferase